MIYSIDSHNPNPEIIAKAVNHIKEGSLVIIPTDTAYMLATNALNEKAISRVFEFKARPRSNPIHVAVANLESAERYVFINEYAKILGKKFLPGPLTLILPKKEIIPDELTATLPTLGLRIPNNEICIDVLNRCGLPLTATSVNITEKLPTYSVEEMKNQFGTRLDEISIILDVGELPRIKPSTIVDLSGSKITILREGPISGKKLFEVIQSFKGS